MPQRDDEPIQLNKHAIINEDELLSNAIPIDNVEPEPEEEVQNDELEPIDLAETDSTTTNAKKIRAFDSHKAHHELWQRQPVVTGTGASHVRTFVSKLRLDAIEHLDQQVNEWLDAHPEYEVKYVSTCVGTLVGKVPEPAIFMSVWV